MATKITCWSACLPPSLWVAYRAAERSGSRVPVCPYTRVSVCVRENERKRGKQWNRSLSSRVAGKCILFSPFDQLFSLSESAPQADLLASPCCVSLSCSRNSFRDHGFHWQMIHASCAPLPPLRCIAFLLFFLLFICFCIFLPLLLAISLRLLIPL